MFCVCYACDDHYAAQLGASMYSLFENNRDLETLDIFLFSNGIGPEDLARLRLLSDRYGRRLKIVDIREITQRLESSGVHSHVENWSLSTWVRAYIPDYISPEYTSALYLDADTLIVGSIMELSRMRPAAALSGVIDIIPQTYKERIGVKGSYINGGVLLFDLRQWKEHSCREKLLGYLKHGTDKYLYDDQDIINAALQGNIAALAPEFNHYPFYGDLRYSTFLMLLGRGNAYYSKEEYKEAAENPVIIHLVYSVLDRPWYKNNLNPYSGLWKKCVEEAGWKDLPLQKRNYTSKEKLKRIVYRLLGSGAVAVLESANRKRYYKGLP